MRFALALLLVVAPAAAHAESDDQPGSVLVVQKRQFQMAHELSLGVGMLPLDAFYKGFTGNVGYTYHFSDHFGWKIGRFSYSQNSATNLKTTLTRDFGVENTKFPEVQFLLGSDLIWSPLYGKTAFMNQSVIYMQLYFIGGVSAAKTVSKDSTGKSVEEGFRPGANLGLGLRFFATNRISLKIEASNHATLGGGGLLNVVDLGAALAINFGGGGR
jgi:outer membrane beta-barrel protein